MFKKITQLIILFFISCSVVKEKKIIEKFKNGQIKTSYYLDSEGKVNGIKKEYDIDGFLKFKYFFSENKLDGESFQYLKKNDTISKIIWLYKNGIVKKQTQYSKNNVKICEFIYKNKKLNGEAIEYFLTGEIKSIWNYKNDIIILGKSFFKNGKLNFIFNYFDGKLNGYSKEYNINGNLIFEWRYENNKLKGVTKEFFPDGTLKKLHIY